MKIVPRSRFQFLFLVGMFFFIFLGSSITFGVDAEEKNELKRRLMEAFKAEQFDLVKELISKGIDINAKYELKTLLMLASEAGLLDMVKMLIERGAGVNVGANGNHTALMFASQNGHLEVVRELIEKRADVNAKAGYAGDTALMLATQGHHLNVVKELVTTHRVAITTRALQACLLVCMGGRLDNSVCTHTPHC
jgi:hypothetical protein